jgi:hypothetical protein
MRVHWKIVGYCEGCGAAVLEMDDEMKCPDCTCYDPTTHTICTVINPLANSDKQPRQKGNFSLTAQSSRQYP